MLFPEYCENIREIMLTPLLCIPFLVSPPSHTGALQMRQSGRGRHHPPGRRALPRRPRLRHLQADLRLEGQGGQLRPALQ